MPAMADIIELTLPIADRQDPQLSFNTRSPGVAMDGSEQIISPLSERWTWAITIPVFTKSAARGSRIIKSGLKGRFNYLLARVCDQYRITRKDIGGVYDGSSVHHSDGSYFSDGSGYSLTQPNTILMVAADENQDQVLMAGSYLAGAMSAGVFFSIDYDLYQVDAWEIDDDGNYIVSFSPPLRAPAAAGAEVDFDAKCLWRLASDGEGMLDLQIGRFGYMRLNLVEPIGRDRT